MKPDIGVASNSYQGTYKKVLCVCSGGILRSPTAAHILAGSPYNYNTRSAGTQYYALNPVTELLVSWADEIVVMETKHKQMIESMLESPNVKVWGHKPSVLVLHIPDTYSYRDPELVELIKERYRVVSSNSRTPDCRSGSEGAEPSTTAKTCPDCCINPCECKLL